VGHRKCPMIRPSSLGGLLNTDLQWLIIIKYRQSWIKHHLIVCVMWKEGDGYRLDMLYVVMPYVQNVWNIPHPTHLTKRSPFFLFLFVCQSELHKQQIMLLKIHANSSHARDIFDS